MESSHRTNSQTYIGHFEVPTAAALCHVKFHGVAIFGEDTSVDPIEMKRVR